MADGQLLSSDFSLLEHVDDDNDDDYYNDNNDDDLARWVKKIVISTDKLI